MKDLIDVRDYLVGHEIVGDWDGNEEEVVDRINSMIYIAFDMIPDDSDSEFAERIIDELWAAVAGQDFVIESEIDELESWAITFIRQKLNEIEYD